MGGKCSTCGMRATRTILLSGYMKGTNNLVDVSVDGLMVLQLMLKKYTLSIHRGLCFSGIIRGMGGYRRFGTTYRSHLQGSSSPGR